MKLLFKGYSDDTFGEYASTNDDVDNCASLKPIHCVLRSGQDGMIITGQYANNPISGTWMIGIAQLDEDILLPDWNMAFGSEGYTATLSLDVPDDTTLEWYNNERVVEM